ATDEVLMRVFTTRPDTVYGVTFMAIAPEHPIVEELLTSKENVLTDAQKAEVRTFIQDVRAQSAFERESEAGEKKGMFIGRYVHNPLYPDDKRFDIPVYVGNYVLMYGTGLVMAVPAHDQRDFEFAKKKNLRMIQVIVPPTSAMEEFPVSIDDWTAAFTGEGISVNSTDEAHNALATSDMKDAVADKLSEIERGGKTITYRLRDWLISRQRYWGCPIPMVYCDDCGVQKVSDEDLPVMLPMDIEFKGLKGNPLEASQNFQKVKCPKCGKPARRETDTMDTFVDSSWYFLRYLDSKNTDKIFDAKKIEYWMSVDQYIGGIEHATGHLIFARFFTKVFSDLGLINMREPFKKLFTQGMIHKEAFFSEKLGFLRPDEVEGVDSDGKYADREVLHAKSDNSSIEVRMEKMSKSKYNVVDPAYLIEQYGADTERIYTLFIGPPAKDAEWQDDAVIGSHRFLKRLWEQANSLIDIVNSQETEDNLSERFKKLQQVTHFSMSKVTHDLEHGFHFNTAIAQIMTLSNEIRDSLRGANIAELSAGTKFALAEAITTAIKLIAPMAPHFAEEIWQHFGNDKSIFTEKWPVADDKWLEVDEIELPIQINGKVRSKITVSAETDDAEVEKIALADEKVQKNIEGKKIIKFIIVKQKIINIIVK
ncbi:MAG: leucine--tRNA ligase, partial [Planctomycetes bacterium]|nr:leucine--tRNA ligase [Planctomycetota bacterium]